MKIHLGFLCFSLVLLSACTPEANTTAPQEKTTVTQPKAEAAAPVEKPVAKNSEFPSLKIKTFDNKNFDLAEHRGKWVIVNFWATWCGPCKTEIPEFNKLDKARDDVDFIGLAYEEIERPDMEAFLKIVPINYPIAILDVYNPPVDFDTPAGLPLTYVIAPDGKVASKFLGPVTSQELEKVLVIKK
jgi:thiol-disulfide isomerase/thioredoxin